MVQIQVIGPEEQCLSLTTQVPRAIFTRITTTLNTQAYRYHLFGSYQHVRDINIKRTTLFSLQGFSTGNTISFQGDFQGKIVN